MQTVEPRDAHPIALQQLRRFRDLEALAGRLSTIATELAEARKLASRQAEAREQAEKLSLSLSGQRSARVEITEHLEQAEQERERFLEQAREAQADLADCQRTLDAARARQKELSDREPIWRDLATSRPASGGRTRVPPDFATGASSRARDCGAAPRPG